MGCRRKNTKESKIGEIHNMIYKTFTIQFPNNMGAIADIFENDINQVILQKLQKIIGHIEEDK